MNIEKDFKIVGIGIKSKSSIDWIKFTNELKQYLISDWSSLYEYNFTIDKSFVTLKIDNKKLSISNWEGVSHGIKMWLKNNYTTEKFGLIMIGKEIKHRTPFEELPIEKQIEKIQKHYDKRNKLYKEKVDNGETIEWHWIDRVIKINKDNYDDWLKKYGTYKG
jgi:hypothetical protein